MGLIVVSILFLALGIFCFAAFYYKSLFFGTMPWQVNTNKKLIALTFDDGPNQPWTEVIASVIESYGGHSTFFVVGKNCLRFPGVVKDLQNRGHEIGAHSYSHAFHKYFTDPFYRTEITKAQAVLVKEGIATTTFRFPWLFRTPWLLKSVKKFGYKTPISGQFAHPFEPFQVDAKKIAKHTLKIARPGAIIIFHDGYNATTADRTQTLKALKIVTKELHKQGYEFVTVTQLQKSS